MGGFVPCNSTAVGVQQAHKSTGFGLHSSLVHPYRLVEKKEFLNFKTHFPLILVKTFGQRPKSGLAIHVFTVGL